MKGGCSTFRRTSHEGINTVFTLGRGRRTSRRVHSVCCPCERRRHWCCRRIGRSENGKCLVSTLGLGPRVGLSRLGPRVGLSGARLGRTRLVLLSSVSVRTVVR